MKELCDEIKQEFDYVFIDCPAGIEHGFKNAIVGADDAIIVTNSEVSAVRDADSIIGLLESNEKFNFTLIINRLKPEMVKRGKMLSIKDVKEVLNIELIGVVPEDDRIINSSNKGEPAVLDGSSKAGQAYISIAKRILDPKDKFVVFEEDKGWLNKLKNIFSRGN